MEISLHLPEQKFNDTPTKTQLDNTLGDIITFLNKVAGAYLANGEYTIADQSIGTLLNGTVQLRAAKDMFANGSTNGLVPAGPRAVPAGR